MAGQHEQFFSGERQCNKLEQSRRAEHQSINLDYSSSGSGCTAAIEHLIVTFTRNTHQPNRLANDRKQNTHFYRRLEVKA